MNSDPIVDDMIHVIMEEAKERFERRKRGEAETETPRERIDDLHPRLYDYAKSKFPFMGDELILKNANDILFHMEHGGMLDGHPLGMRLDRNTGIISLHIFIPA